MAQYPAAAGTDANLFIAANNLSTSLTDNPLTIGATTINVASTTGFPTAGYITIEAEAISYTGLTGTSFTGCTRGADGTAAASHVTGLSVLHDVVAAHHNALKDEIKAVEGDLVGVMAAITPTSPASTATSMLNRWAQLVQQIKNITGTTNWYDSITNSLTQLLPLSGGTMSGAIAMGSHKITGLTNGSAASDAAAFGQVGGTAGVNAAGYVIGTIVQQVQVTDTTLTTSVGTAYTSTATAATIVPKATTHKIKISVVGTLQNTAPSSNTVNVSVFRGSTDLSNGSGFSQIFAGTLTGYLNCPVGITYLDSPATTASTVYTVKIKSGVAADGVWNAGTGAATILVEEVAA